MKKKYKLPYRDIEGYVIRAPYKAVLKRSDGKCVTAYKYFSNVSIIARYVYCPEINSLIHWQNCQQCEDFHKFGLRYLWCNSQKDNTPPPFYDVERPAIKRRYKQRKKKGQDNETDNN